MNNIKKAHQLLKQAEDILNKKIADQFLKLTGNVKKLIEKGDFEKAMIAEDKLFKLSQKLQKEYKLDHYSEEGTYFGRIDDYSFEIMQALKRAIESREKSKKEILSWMSDMEKRVKI